MQQIPINLLEFSNQTQTNSPYKFPKQTLNLTPFLIRSGMRGAKQNKPKNNYRGCRKVGALPSFRDRMNLSKKIERESAQRKWYD